MQAMQLFRSPLSLFTAVLTCFLPNPTTASCECGYLVNSTAPNTASTGNTTIFTNILETDFLHLSSLADTKDWAPQSYTVSSALTQGLYGKNASLNNVFANPLQSAYDWAGIGTNNGGAGGLQLYVRSGSTVAVGGMIGISELATTRSDILYGSFRAGMKIPSVNGTCSAFFFYRNDTQEIDIELLSVQRQDQNPTSYTANLVIQSQQTIRARLGASSSTPAFLPYHLPFDPTTGFHEYRYDWTPTAVSFYADGQLLDTMTTPENIPSSPGEIHLSHWSNGDSTCPGGPPESDAVLTISYLKAYFNTSANTAAPTTTCGQTGPNVVCPVPDVGAAPDGNASVHEAWFADGGDGKVWDGKGKAKTGAEGAAVSSRKDGMMTGALQLLLYVLALGLGTIWWIL